METDTDKCYKNVKKEILWKYLTQIVRGFVKRGFPGVSGIRVDFLKYEEDSKRQQLQVQSLGGKRQYVIMFK